MTKLVAAFAPTIAKGTGPNEKYVRQTYDAMSNSNINLEAVAIQIAKMPVREQRRFFRLFLNYVDVTSSNTFMPTMRDEVDLCNKIINVVNDHYEQLEIDFNA